MPRPEYLNRQFLIYFPSEEDRERWKKLAADAGMPLSKWIYETVELHMSEADRPRGNLAKDLTQAREEVHRLRDELKMKDLVMEKYETELFRLRHQSFLKPQLEGRLQHSEELIQVLKQGGSWSGQDILRVLSINPRDSEAVRIVSRMLFELQEFGLVEEDALGWRWIG